MALRRHVKNFVKNYSEAEVKVREATSNDPWGPSSSLMLEISDLTYNTISLSEIMNMIWHRMNDHGKNWRHVYKSLTLLDYLLKNGSKKVIQHCQEGFYNIQLLKDFHHLDGAGKDQGFHVREKVKQVLALLKNEQLLHNEREIARRTRRRTSYAMLFPQKVSEKAYIPTVPGSNPISEVPPSENVQHLLPKALPAAEQSKPAQVLAKAETAKETTLLNISTKQSSEDLIIFSEDESCPAVAQTIFPATAFKEELVKGATKGACQNDWNTSTVLSPSERNPVSLQKWDSGEKSRDSVVSRTFQKSPSRRQSSVHSHKVATTLLDLWSSGPEEFITVNKQQTPKSDFDCCHTRPSVETIYKSPTIQTFDPLESPVTNTQKSSPTSQHCCGPSVASLRNLHFLTPSLVEAVGLSGLPAPRPDSTSSIGTTSSFSTFSMSSPESAVPNNTPQPHSTASHGPLYLTTPQGLPSTFFKDLKERIAHSFSPCPVSDVDDNASILSLLPDNSKFSIEKNDGLRSRTCCASGESWANNLVQDVFCAPHPVTPPAANLPGKDLFPVSPEEKSMMILEEIKNAVCGLRGDFCNVAQELRTIGSELANMVASVQNMNQFFAASQSAKDDPSQI